MSTSENLSVPRRRIGSKTLYLRISGSTSSIGEPLIFISPRPLLTKATATAVFFGRTSENRDVGGHKSRDQPFCQKFELSSWALEPKQQEQWSPYARVGWGWRGREKREGEISPAIFLANFVSYFRNLMLSLIFSIDWEGRERFAMASEATPTTPLQQVFANKIKSYQALVGEGTTKTRNTNIQKLELLWDVEELLLLQSAHDKKELTAAGPQLTKLAELILTSISQPVCTPGPPVRRLLAVSLVALHSHVPTRHLFTLVDAFHTALTKSKSSLPTKL